MSLTQAYIVKGTKGEHRNENEYYPTPAIATLTLLRNTVVPQRLWEPAAGRGHISQELNRNGHDVVSTDLYGYADPYVPVETGVDFLTADRRDVDGVITNPPFKSNLPEKLIHRMLDEHKYEWLGLFCRLTFMESMRRHKLFTTNPPSEILVLSGRVNCNEKYFEQNHGLGGMVAYAWFVWDRTEGPTSLGETKVKWVKPGDYVGELNMEDDVVHDQ